MLRVTVTAIALALTGFAPGHGAGTNPEAAATQAPVVDKRMSHYGRQVLESVATMAVEEATASGGVKLSDSTLRTLRIALGRYLDAGEKLGLTEALIAETLGQQYETVYRGAIPVALRGAGGRLDTEALVASAVEYRRSTANAAAEATYLNQIRMEGQSALVQDATTGGPGLIAVMQPPTEVDAVKAVADQRPAQPLPPEYRAVVDRIEDSGGERRITIRSGDTLGLIARAVYGDTLRYRDIFEWNRQTLASPDRLTVGVTLILPPA